MSKLTKLLLPFLVFGTTTFSQISGKWGDQCDGTYYNPMLPGDYSDLDAIRVGSDFYTISSTMQFSPGMVVLHSKDLVNWRNLNSVNPTFKMILWTGLSPLRTIRI